MDAITHLGSVVDKQGGTYANIKTRIGKAKEAFVQLKTSGNPKDKC